MRLFCMVLIPLCFASCSVSKNAAKNKITFADNIVIAHRGAWKKNNLPENSIASLRQAIALKCYGSEFDIRMTADDSLIINHDTTYHNLPVEKTNYADLAAFKLANGEKLPTLREYILAGLKNNSTTKLICEIKPSTISKDRGMLIATKVVTLIQELNAENNVEYISFSYEILKKIAELKPAAITQYLYGNKSPDILKADSIKGADYPLTVFQSHPEWIENAKKNNISLNAWTIKNAADMDWLIANEFNAITTDEPELLFDRIKISPVTQGWKLAWSDEFNYKGLPDSTKWNYDFGGHGWGNNEKQFYLEKSIENSYVADGRLHIVALKKDYEKLNYTSAKLTTYQKLPIQYGKIEVMAKLPRGKGSWPAIWMLPESIRTNKENWPLCGEIDIMEHVGKDPNVVHTSLHTQLYNHMKGTQITHFDTLQNVFNVFHKYGIEWTEAYIKFYIDDKLFYESFKGQDGRVATNEGWPFDKPYYLILNLAIGGNWGGEIDNSIFPNKMQVDFVRVYKKSENNTAK